MSTLLHVYTVEARTAQEAQQEAVRRVREDPTRRLRTVTRCRPTDRLGWWAVEVAYVPVEEALA